MQVPIEEVLAEFRQKYGVGDAGAASGAPTTEAPDGAGEQPDTPYYVSGAASVAPYVGTSKRVPYTFLKIVAVQAIIAGVLFTLVLAAKLLNVDVDQVVEKLLPLS